MNNADDAPARRGRMVRWGAGITLAGFVVGGGLAAVAMSGNAASSASAGRLATSANTQAGNAELSTLLSASTAPGAARTKPGPLRRIRGIGGYYGSLTFRGGTLAFERGTIQSVNHDDVIVRAPDGTTMTWRLVGDTVVRDHGKASSSVLSDGQLVFVGGRAVDGARDARLIVVRQARPATAKPNKPNKPTAAPAEPTTAPTGSTPATTPSASTGVNAS